MQTELSISARIYFALNLHKASHMRQRAATLVARYVREFHLYGYNPGYQSFVKVCRRFRLGDFAQALQVHYPPRPKLTEQQHNAFPKGRW